MKIATNLAIPYDVYRFYLKVAEHMKIVRQRMSL